MKSPSHPRRLPQTIRELTLATAIIAVWLVALWWSEFGVQRLEFGCMIFKKVSAHDVSRAVDTEVETPASVEIVPAGRGN